MMTEGFDLVYEVRKITNLKYEGRNSRCKAPVAGMSKSSGAIQEEAVLWNRGTQRPGVLGVGDGGRWGTAVGGYWL